MRGPVSRHPRAHSVRRVVYGLIVLTVVGLVSLMATVSLGQPAGHEAAGPATTAGKPDPHAPIIVLTTSHLSWSTVLDAARTPSSPVHDEAVSLMGYASANTPVNLVQRTAASATCPADALLTLGAGARTRAHGQDAECPGSTTWDQAVRASQASGYGAQPGALASSLRRAGRTTTSVGDGALLVLTSRSGTPPPSAPDLGAAVEHGLADLTVVDLPARSPQEALRALSTSLELVPEDARVLVLSVADPTDPAPQMGILPAGTSSPEGTAPPANDPHGPALVVGPSTHQAGLIQLSDLAPSILDALKAKRVPSMEGASLMLPETAPGGELRDTQALESAPRSITALADDALRARASQLSTIPVSLLIILSGLLLLAWAVPALRGPRGRQRLRAATMAATVVATLPVGAWFAALVPWWRVGAQDNTPSGWAVVVAMVLTVAIGTAVAGTVDALVRITTVTRDRWLVRHQDRPGRLTRGRQLVRMPAVHEVPAGPYLTALGVAALSTGVILLDAAGGARMAFNGLLGMNAVVAGRFFGISNTAFALAGAALIVGVAASTGPWVRWQPTVRQQRIAAALGVGVPGGLALVLDGAPGLGADVGGTLTLILSLAAMGVWLAGGQVGWRIWVGISTLSISVVGLFGLVDHALGSRTHMGRFVGQLQEGTASTTILRKATAIVSPFISSPLAVLALVAGLSIMGLMTWWLVREARSWKAGLSGYAPLTTAEPDGDRVLVPEPSAAAPGQAWAAAVPAGRRIAPPWLPAALKALAVLIVAEVLVNDSGTSMAIFSLASSVPLLLALVTAHLQDRP